jgi:predicted nuclease of predicted toxin-antitoxin system
MDTSGVKLFIDECLSPRLATALNSTGLYEAAHPRDWGGLGDPDHVVLARCLAEARVIVTENAVDFRKLLGKQEIHPGLIIIPSVSRDRSIELVSSALTYLASLGNPNSIMINQILEIREPGEFVMSSRNT